MNRLKEMREFEKMTLAEFSKRTNINEKDLRKYEKGLKEPHLKTWQHLAHILDVPVGYLRGVDFRDDIRPWLDSHLEEYDKLYDPEWRKFYWKLVDWYGKREYVEYSVIARTEDYEEFAFNNSYRDAATNGLYDLKNFEVILDEQEAEKVANVSALKKIISENRYLPIGKFYWQEL